MSKVVQEKFQINYPQQGNDDSHGGWVTDMSARAKKGIPGREGAAGGDPTSRHTNNAMFMHSLPPGSDIQDQEFTDQREMALKSVGSYSDVSIENMPIATEKALRNGFGRLKMLSTDDMYTREHNDAFYDVVEVDGQEGFVERNNYLDRS